MRTHVHRDDGGAVVRIAGTFDAADADELGLLAESLQSTSGVVFDFHEVEAVDDCAIAKFAAALHLLERGRFILVGLPEHHHRLLQYVGEEPPGRAHVPEG